MCCGPNVESLGDQLEPANQYGKSAICSGSIPELPIAIATPAVSLALLIDGTRVITPACDGSDPRKWGNPVLLKNSDGRWPIHQRSDSELSRAVSAPTFYCSIGEQRTDMPTASTRRDTNGIRDARYGHGR